MYMYTKFIPFTCTVQYHIKVHVHGQHVNKYMTYRCTQNIILQVHKYYVTTYIVISKFNLKW